MPPETFEIRELPRLAHPGLMRSKLTRGAGVSNPSERDRLPWARPVAYAGVPPTQRTRLTPRVCTGRPRRRPRGRNLAKWLQERNICPAMAKLAEEVNALRPRGAPSLTPPMLAQPQSAEPAPPRVAVLLNARARKVTPRVVRALSHVVPRADLYLSRSPNDARDIARTILTRGYDTVFCGGGDGTFIGFADEILSQAERAHAAAPRFGVLKLGTGNGLAALVQASPVEDGGVVDDVRRAREGAVPCL